MSMSELELDATWELDDDVIVGYAASRCLTDDLVLGRGARLRSGTVVYAGSTIGDDFETGHNVTIREQSQIGDGVSIWTNTVVDYGCRIGDRVKIHSNCYISQRTVLEDDAFLAPGVTLANDLYPGYASSAEVMAGPYIEAGAQLGVNVTVLPYVRIGARAIVGAGAVVTKDVPPDSIVYGNPATVARARTDLGDVDVRVRDRAARAPSLRVLEEAP